MIKDNTKIEFDLERTPLQIKTIQGGDVLSVFLYDESGAGAGRIYLRDLTSSYSSHSSPFFTKISNLYQSRYSLTILNRRTQKLKRKLLHSLIILHSSDRFLSLSIRRAISRFSCISCLLYFKNGG